MALDDLVRSRMKKMKPVESVQKVADTIRKAPGRAIGGLYERVKLKGKAGFGKQTATDTGARREALTRKLQGKNSYGGYVANTVKGGIKGGIGERAPSQDDVEEMIRKGS